MSISYRVIKATSKTTTEEARIQIETSSADETKALGCCIGLSLEPGWMIGLVGPLGAGKTQLVKGICAGNTRDPSARVTSPTFTLIHEYPGRVRLVHVDTYRLANPEAELQAMGFDELLDSDAAVVVEWADRVRSLLQDSTVWITIAPTGENTRSIDIQGRGRAAETLISGLQNQTH